MRTAFVFPGQAAHRPGMLAAWRGHPAGAGAIDRVGRATGLDLWRLGDDAKACGASTALAQPAIHAASMAAADALDEAGVRPDLVAGHSLGEVTAAVAAGMLDREDGAQLVGERGRAMGEACRTTDGAMAAVLRCDVDTVRDLLPAHGDVVVANVNAPGQVVLAGPADELDALEDPIRDAGGRLRRLDVEGAFHSPAMTPALVRVDAVLRRLPIRAPRVPVVSGVDAHPHTSADAVARRLVDGVLAPVRWVDVQRALADLGVGLLVEVGPGGVLAGCAKRTVPDVECVGVSCPEDVAALADRLDEVVDLADAVTSNV